MNDETFPDNAALIVVDVQNDFCPGGALGVRGGDEVVDPVNSLMPLFHLVIATRDWHPPGHISFRERGGPWPPHCVQGSYGAQFHSRLDTTRIAIHTSKSMNLDRDDYSAFASLTDDAIPFDRVLKEHGIDTIYIGGLATDYCVKETALDGLAAGYTVYVITDAVRAVNVNPNDGVEALKLVAARGAHLIDSDALKSERQRAAAAGPQNP